MDAKIKSLKKNEEHSPEPIIIGFSDDLYIVADKERKFQVPSYQVFEASGGVFYVEDRTNNPRLISNRKMSFSGTNVRTSIRAFSKEFLLVWNYIPQLEKKRILKKLAKLLRLPTLGAVFVFSLFINFRTTLQADAPELLGGDKRREHVYYALKDRLKNESPSRFLKSANTHLSAPERKNIQNVSSKRKDVLCKKSILDSDVRKFLSIEKQEFLKKKRRKCL